MLRNSTGLFAAVAVLLATGVSGTTTYLLTNAVATGDIWVMNGTNYATSTDITTDIRQAKSTADKYLIVKPGALQAATVTALPAAIQNRGWRTESAVSGDGAAGNWTVSYKLRNRAGSGAAFSGIMNYRAWVSTDAAMAGATNVTGWVASPNTLSFSGAAGQTLTDTASFVVPARNYSSEYIYIEFAWDIVTASTDAQGGFYFVSDEASGESLTIQTPLNLNTPTLVLTNPDIGKSNPADNATLACSVTCTPQACTNLNLWAEYNPGAGFTAIPTAATGGLQANAGAFSCGSVASCSNSWSVMGLSNATFPVRCAANATTPSRSAQSASQNVAVYVGVLGTPSFSPASPYSVSIYDPVNLSGDITCTSPAVAKAGCGATNMTARTGSASATTEISGATDLALITGTTTQTCSPQFPLADGGSYTCAFSQITANMTVGDGNGVTRYWDILFNSSDTQVTDVDPADRQVVGRVGNSTVTVTSPDISVKEGTTFSINATVSCTGYRCISVNAYARYNATTASADTPFSTGSGSVPGWLTANPLSCSRIEVSGSCLVQFNGTAGSTTGSWLYDVLTNSTVAGTSGANAADKQFSVTAAARPDLNITNNDIALNNTSPYENDTVQINATFRNSGSAAATSVNVTYYINSTQQCSFVVPSMVPGATNTTSCSWTPTTQGNYTILVAVDPSNAITESSETNNNATRNVTVNRRLPDLMMNASSLSLNNTSPMSGDTVQINATVYNIGNATAANVNVTYYANSTVLCSFGIPSLTAGASNTTTCNWNATSGDWSITAAADPGNAITETNETNNNASTLLSAGARTNLTIFDDTDTVTRGPGEQVKFYANYTNVPAGTPVSGALCQMQSEAFNGTVNMTYNATSTLYEYNRSFSAPGTYSWNATCSKTGFQTQNRTDTFTIFSFAFVTTDRATYTNCNSVYYRISLFNMSDSLADESLGIQVTDSAGSVKQSLNASAAGGVYAGSYAFSQPVATGTWTIKVNTSCVLHRQNFSVGEGNSDIWKIRVSFSPEQGGYSAGTTITINSYVYNLRGIGVAGLGANVSANVDGTNVTLTDNGLGRYTASYLTSSTGAHYFEIRAITGSVNVTNRRGFFVR